MDRSSVRSFCTRALSSMMLGVRGTVQVEICSGPTSRKSTSGVPKFGMVGAAPGVFQSCASPGGAGC